MLPSITDEDLEKLLNREATAFQRDVEVERILKAFKLNPYEILGIDYEATPADIKKRYRHLSLFIHPDKASHPKASDAFDMLKKAESDLSDKDKRLDLDATILQARTQVLKGLGLPQSIADTDFKLQELNPSFKDRIRQKSKELLIDEEVARRKAYKLTLANEGLEAKKKEEEAEKKKRKAEDDQRWEETREQRVDSWRSFNTGGSKKKKKSKVPVLG
ncbi:hypothetical protein BOTBODRAFT_121576 [Botryobasidium botryosum FD-172 SS1]|uniref:J domain-containing protein n=1 Tax=Botryobasidium botryosum (strain FD-172 SS1) TaxID=930990 RepID=A0A067LTK2_BOTB1|nr:hypothetical protein BOTBODRAFT_121576 [Botryobasidium botryosum FD-172 SS1]